MVGAELDLLGRRRCGLRIAVSVLPDPGSEDDDLAAETLPARAVLAAAQGAVGAHLLILAPTTLPREGFIAPLVDALGDPGVALVGPRVVDREPVALVFEDGRLHVVDRGHEPDARRPFTVPSNSKRKR